MQRASGKECESVDKGFNAMCKQKCTLEAMFGSGSKISRILRACTANIAHFFNA